MEFKGSKGKWEATPLNDGSDLHAIFSAKNNTLISRTCYMPFSKANAQLIAHAPEMLEMLDTVLNDYYNIIPQSEARDNRMRQINDLLTRATTI